MSSHFEDSIRELWQSRSSKPEWSPAAVKTVNQVMKLLECGELRVAEPTKKESNIEGAPHEWVTNAWVKEAILLKFLMTAPYEIQCGALEYFDKLSPRRGFREMGVRAVAGAIVREGAHIEAGAILMPSFVNTGAWVGSGTMIDTWATVGSCAQVGRNVHLSGGVGLGGVLEPPQAQPVIIEDECFIGSRAIIVEGVIVEKAAVIAAGVVLTASTPIIDVTSEKEITYRGRVPERSIVIPGVRSKSFKSGSYGVPCALIIGVRSATKDSQESTGSKVSLEMALREIAQA